MDSTNDRRRANVGPPSGVPERRTHTTRSGLTASDADKMSCPFCRWRQSAVVRGHGCIQIDAVHRRRECARCGNRFPTKETVDYECLEREQNTATPSTPEQRV